MKVESRQVICEEGKTCASVKCGADLFLFSYDGPAKMSCGDIRFYGTALLLKSDAAGRPQQAYMVDGELLNIGVRRVYANDAPSPARTINLL